MQKKGKWTIMEKEEKKGKQTVMVKIRKQRMMEKKRNKQQQKKRKWTIMQKKEIDNKGKKGLYGK